MNNCMLDLTRGIIPDGIINRKLIYNNNNTL